MSDIRFNQWLHQSGTGGVSQDHIGNIGIGTTNPSIVVSAANTAVLNVGVITANNLFVNNAFNGDITGNVTGNISGATGTFSGNVDIADKIIHTGDTDTAMRFPADNTFAVDTAGSERLRVTSDGKVGVNTNAATARLDISHPNTEQGLVVRSRYGNIATAMVKFDGDPAGNGGDGNVLHLHGGNSRTDSEILHIDSTGVGDIFDIRGDGLTRVYKQLQLEHSSNVAKIIFNEYGANDIKAQIEMDQVNGSAGQLIFRTQDSGTLSERLRITSTGLIDVSGGIHVTENITPTSGRGVEIFEASAGVGQIQSFNRTGGSFDELRLKGSEVRLYAGSALKLDVQSAQSYLYGTSDGILNLDTTDSRGAFIRYKENGTTKAWVGCSEGIGTGGDQDDLGLRAVDKFRFKAGSVDALLIDSNGSLNSGNITISGAQNTHNPNNYSMFLADNHANTFFGVNFRLGYSSGSGNHQLEVNNQHSTIGGAGILIGGNNSNYVNEIQFINISGNQSAGTRVDDTKRRMSIESSGRVVIHGNGTVRSSYPGAVCSIHNLAMMDAGSGFSWGLRSNSGDTQWCLERIVGTNSFSDSNIKFRVYNNGNYMFAGSNSSDRDIKENIQDISGTSLNLIDQLRPRTFNFKESEGYSTEPKTGFVAQEIGAVIPSIVNGTDGQKDMGVDYNGLVAHLVKAVQELKAENDSLRSRLDTAGL